MDTRAVTGITMGDPSGVGPEIIVKVFHEDDIFRVCRPVILGDPGVLSKYLDKSIILNEIRSPEEAAGQNGRLDVIRLSSLEEADFVPGKPTPSGGRAMVEYILSAVDMAVNGKISGLVTCPINKALMNRAGFNFDGHTELLAHLTKIGRASCRERV